MRHLLRLYPYVRANWRLLLTVVTLGLLSQVALLIIPKVVQQVIYLALEHSERGIAPWALLILLLAVVKGILAGLETLLGTRLGQKVLRDLRQDIYAHLTRLRLRFFDQTRSGELLSRVTSDLEPIEGFVSWGARLIFRSSLLFIGVLIFCFSMNPPLTLVSLAFLPLMSATAFIIGTRLRPAWQEAREEVGNFTSALEETLSGIRVVKMCTQEKNEIAKLTRSSEAIKQKTRRANQMDATYYPLTGLWAGAAGVAILAVGGMQVIAGKLTIPQYISFEMYLMFLLVPMRMLGWMVSGMQRAAVGTQRIGALLDEQAEPGVRFQGSGVREAESGDSRGGFTKPPAISSGGLKIRPYRETLRGRVQFDNVTFGYRENEPVLKNLSMEVEAGETVGILGPTGSGKSALVALIPRLYDPQEGRVLMDGEDIRNFDLTWLRRQVGFVFQESFLFSGTIRENITFARPEATQEEMEAAARRAALHEFIAGLERGYETRVGERGLNLSGGQQQRLALARVLLTDPRILILDDCTSSVDADTEFQIQEALAEFMRGRTTFIISQRTPSVAQASRIIVLDDGQIVEQGTPAELAARPGGLYWRLVEVQKSLAPGAQL